MKPATMIETEVLEILKTEIKDKTPKQVRIVGLGPAYIVEFVDGSRLLSDLLPKEVLDKTFPAIRQMWE
jgi:hypothetical protein